MTPSTLISSFRAAGIHPFNPDKIPASATAPSSLFKSSEDTQEVDQPEDLLHAQVDVASFLEERIEATKRKSVEAGKEAKKIFSP